MRCAGAIARLFSKYDTNDDGKLDMTEVKALTRELAPDLTEEESKEAFRVLDTDGSRYPPSSFESCAPMAAKPSPVRHPCFEMFHHPFGIGPPIPPGLCPSPLTACYMGRQLGSFDGVVEASFCSGVHTT